MQKPIKTFLHPQFHHRSTRPAFVLGWLNELLYMWMLLQELPNGLAQDSHSMAMNDADARNSSQEGPVDKLLYFTGGGVHVLADDVDLRGMFKSSFRDTDTPFERAACTGEAPACTMTSATSCRGTFIFIAPISTSKVFSSTFRLMTAVRPIDLSFTVSPSELGFTSYGHTLGSPASAPVLWATTDASNCSLNSRRSLAMRRSASFDSF